MRFNPRVMVKMRERKGWSRRDLHHEMGRRGWKGTEKTLWGLETGKVRFPQSATLEALASALGVEERVFFRRKTSTADRM